MKVLVENALKHNIFTKEKPLKISIKQEGDFYLSVENNVQEKAILEKSTKVGLQNICNRYQLLSNKHVEIIKEEGIFKVRIPLIQSELSPVALL